jgi:23S rRNA pseudouridine2605 synthase
VSEKTARRIGLARALSKLGYCSRSRAAELIRAGRVRLNGNIPRDPETPVRPDKDHIQVDDQPIDPPAKIYLMLNKPRGLVTTASDEKGRKTIYSLFDERPSGPTCAALGIDPARSNLPWLAPVGRLDKASEGLLLLTNDSEWGARIAAPETHLDKTYHVQIGIVADKELIESLVRGVKTEEGDRLRAKQARLLRTGEKNCWLEIVLDEGKSRHIRRMLSELGVDVLRLIRVAIGPLRLGSVSKGAFRVLSETEKRMLDAAMARK